MSDNGDSEPRRHGDDAVQEENRKIRRLRRLVSITTQLLYQQRYSREEAERLVAVTRHEALRLFPGKEETFEIVYGSKFDRILESLYGRTGSGTVH